MNANGVTMEIGGINVNCAATDSGVENKGWEIAYKDGAVTITAAKAASASAKAYPTKA